MPTGRCWRPVPPPVQPRTRARGDAASDETPLLAAATRNVLDAASAQRWMLGVLADIGALMPAAFALGVCRRFGSDEHRSEEHTSELQSLMRISYAVFCLKKKTNRRQSICNYR